MIFLNSMDLVVLKKDKVVPLINTNEKLLMLLELL